MAKKVRDILTGDEARAALAAGVNKIANAVKCTLGPRGRLALLGRPGLCNLTKDGVSVARDITLADPFENEGAKLCIEAAFKCNSIAGDGTTSACVLAQSLVNEGLKYGSKGGNPVSIKNGMDIACKEVLNYLQEVKTEVSSAEEIKFVATISGNDSEVGQIVSDAFIKVGKEGVVSFELTQKPDTTLVMTDGYTIDRGFISTYFAADQNKIKTEYTDPVILLWGSRIVDMQEIGAFLNNIMPQINNRPILIIAEDVAENALATLILNHLKGTINVACIKCPGFGERKDHLMDDLAKFTGGVYCNPKLSYKLSNINPKALGSSQKVIITRDHTTFVNNFDNTSLSEYITALKTQSDECESQHDKDKFTERIAKLSDKIAVINIGAQTDSELNEKRYRYEDAINATKAALEEGIVPGGGATLLSASRNVVIKTNNEDEATGAAIVLQALESPLFTIASNAGYNGGTVVDKTLEKQRSKKTYNPAMGFDAKTGEYTNLLERGIIDPVKVTRSALENAVSIAGLLLITETVIVDAPSKEPPYNPMESMM